MTAQHTAAPNELEQFVTEMAPARVMAQSPKPLSLSLW